MKIRKRETKKTRSTATERGEITPSLPGQHIYPIGQDHEASFACKCGPFTEMGTYGPAILHRDENTGTTDWLGYTVKDTRRILRRLG